LPDGQHVDRRTVRAEQGGGLGHGRDGHEASLARRPKCCPAQRDSGLVRRGRSP
jgi:hypothetical protein